MKPHELNDKILIDADGTWHFKCPACNTLHAIAPEGCSAQGGKWQVSNINPLTISPSVKTSYFKLSEVGEDMIDKGESPPAGGRYPGDDVVCHFFLREGILEYLSDCTHAMRNTKVPMVSL